MSAYTVTVTPDAASGPALRVKVEANGHGPRIREFHVQAGEGGLESVPFVDLDALVNALAGALPEGTPAVEAKQVKEEPKPKRGRPAVKAGKAAAVKMAKAKTEKAGDRSYRKMPDPEEVIGVFRQAGTITAVAEHYNIPRHTAQGWAGRLRKLGYDVPTARTATKETAEA